MSLKRKYIPEITTHGEIYGVLYGFYDVYQVYVRIMGLYGILYGF